MVEVVAQQLSVDDLNALVQARHSDPFSLLGMHVMQGRSGLLVRSLQPDALSVAVIDKKTGKQIDQLEQISADGLFAGTIGRRKKLFHYMLRVRYEHGEVDVEDPYRFASQLNEQELYLFCEGTEERAYRFLGAHTKTIDSVEGVSFAVWAPNAQRVSVVGEFNQWDGRRHMMRKHPAAGIWDIFVPGLEPGALYKYEIVGADGTLLPLKADPFARAMQHPPANASVVVQLADYRWSDGEWMQQRNAQATSQYQQPLAIYEVHLASWRRSLERGGNYLDYRELASELIPYALEMGFTHLQLMPVSEFPFDGSWGYQPIGLFAPSSRFGNADDFRYFVDQCHQHNLGVLLDWVPGHFPTDAHGLARFDGTCLYEHEDPRQGFHPDWNTLIYNYSRAEVVSFLLSNALYWLDEFHIDGLRVDAVASMLYLDYGRKHGEWIPNVHGGRENLAAIEFLRQVNARAYFNHKGVMMIAEESTAWPGVSRPVDQGGLGFGFKWNMGWMNDTLSYMSRDPVHRQFHHNEMTFGLLYGFSENFILPLSHDEVVHGKAALLSKMPGDDWQKFANLRAYYGFMYTHPGKKLLFMGAEIAQRDEWNHDRSLDWHLLEHSSHKGIQQLVRDLNEVYCNTPALHQLDCDATGFAWINGGNHEQSVLSFARYGLEGSQPAVVVVNMTPNTHYDFAVGVPQEGFYRELINTDSSIYGGSNQGNAGGVHSDHKACDGQPQSLSICVPPLSTLVFLREPQS